MTGENFIFYNDSGHGWLEVPISLCRELRLQGKITGYSYCKDGNLYLEEDCDAPTFIEAFAKEYNVGVSEFRSNSKKIYHDISPVRNYLGAIPEDLLEREN